MSVSSWLARWTQQLYTWNQSLTLQVWQCEVDRNGGETWHEVDVRTLSTEPRSFSEAREAALRWLYDTNEESG